MASPEEPKTEIFLVNPLAISPDQFVAEVRAAEAELAAELAANQSDDSDLLVMSPTTTDEPLTWGQVQKKVRDNARTYESDDEGRLVGSVILAAASLVSVPVGIVGAIGKIVNRGR